MNPALTKHNWRNASAGVWTGRILSGVFIAFMLFASAFPKLFLPQVSVPIMEQLGWQPKYLLLIGLIELGGTLLYRPTNSDSGRHSADRPSRWCDRYSNARGEPAL